jgi:hypothetical protein
VLLFSAAVLAGCDTRVTMNFTYSNHGDDTVTFSSRVGTTDDWLDSGITVPADSHVSTGQRTVKKDYWFSCVVKDIQNVTLDSIVMTGYEWKTGSAVTWSWDGANLTPGVFIPGTDSGHYTSF